jgi:phenolic acid decarboxylase
VNACGFITGLFTTEDVAISYVGNIEFGKPIQENETTYIPISFTGGQWLQNSGRAFKHVISSLEGSVININVQTCLASGGGQNKEQRITIKNLTKGEYKVNYLNPDGSSVYVGNIKI